MVKILYAVALLILALAGCTPVNTSFQCPITPGIHCKSLGQINQMINAGELGNPKPLPMVNHK